LGEYLVLFSFAEMGMLKPVNSAFTSLPNPPEAAMVPAIRSHQLHVIPVPQLYLLFSE
jgi:hypothetical protein